MSIVEINHDPSADIEAAHSNAGAAWTAQTLEIVQMVAIDQVELATEDIWEYVDMPPSGEARAMGGVFRRAAGLGWIEKTDRTKVWKPYKSGMTGNLGRTTTVWRSKIYGQRSLLGGR